MDTICSSPSQSLVQSITLIIQIMGMGFRLNLKWAFPLQSHFHSSTPSKLFSAASSSSSVSGGKECFNSSRQSFLTVISEESDSFCKDPTKAVTFSSASTQILEDGSFSQTEDIIKAPSRVKHYVSGLNLTASNATNFSLLMQNLGVLEESFADSDVLDMEREILSRLGKFGALKLFNACLSRTLGPSSGLWDLSSTAEEYRVKENEISTETDGDDRDDHGGDHDDDDDNDGNPSKRIVRTRKAEERKSRRTRSKRLENPDSETIWAGQAVKKKTKKSRSRRRVSAAKNEEEMATVVKMVVKLERIRATLEEETGSVSSLSRWAEAAGLDESALQKNLHIGWHCRDELIRSTKSLVLYLARSYRGLGIALDDLLQAGRLGVLQGAERFDQTRGYRFSTYVHYWIKKSMSKLVARHSRGILIPGTLNKAIIQIQKTRKEVNNKLRRYPDDDEIAELTGLSLEKIKSASNCLRVVGSVDHKTSDSFSGKRLEFMSDESMKSPEENVLRQQLRNDIHNLLSNLDPRERQVLILRYGLENSSAPKSLEEVGKLFQVSKEWIRKIENKALRKLRDQETREDLCHYLNL